jgi:hypothetical protein
MHNWRTLALGGGLKPMYRSRQITRFSAERPYTQIQSHIGASLWKVLRRSAGMISASLPRKSKTPPNCSFW